MITEALMNAGLFLMNAILNFLDLLPDMPSEVISVLDEFFDLIFTNGWSLACFLIPMDFALILLPLVILVVNFERVYHLIMWVLRKIPMVGIK